MNRNAILYAVLLALALIAPFGVYPVFLMKVLCFAIFACAFNLLLGFTGLLSFGHAAFFGISGYTTGNLMRDFGWPPELAILAGVAVGGALGLVFGWLAIRRTGIYFAMVTLALAQMIYFFSVQATGFTGGENGLQGVPRGELLGMFDLNNDLTLYYFVLAVFVAAFWLIHRTVTSPFGQILKAVRENEARAISLGYNADNYKLTAFVLSAALSGLGGSLKCIVFQLTSLTDVHWYTSGEVVLMTLLGGMGTILGPLVGAGTIVTLQNYLASGAFASSVPIVIGFIFVVCVMAFRRGIVGEIQAFLKRSF